MKSKRNLLKTRIVKHLLTYKIVHLYELFFCSFAYDCMGDNMFGFDDKKLVVGGFKKILELSDKCIKFDFKRYILIISGEGLRMPYLEDNEVGIKGIIKNIEIKYKMVNESVDS